MKHSKSYNIAIFPTLIILLSMSCICVAEEEEEAMQAVAPKIQTNSTSVVEGPARTSTNSQNSPKTPNARTYTRIIMPVAEQKHKSTSASVKAMPLHTEKQMAK